MSSSVGTVHTPVALAHRVRGALAWSMINNLLGRVGSSLVGIVLARILVPEDYGIYAVALVALSAILSMNELGVSLAIVRWPGRVDRIAPTVVTMAFGTSLALFIACQVAAPWLAERLGSPQASGVLRLLTVGVLIDAATAVPAGLMTREFMQRRRTAIDLTAFVVTSTMSIALAVAGAGAYSLAWGALVGNAISGMAILVWAPARYRPGFSWPVARELLGFGLPLAASSLLVFGMLNLDYIVVGAVLGAVPLGIYLLAFNLSSWPVNLFSAPVRRVAVPAFARVVSDPERGGEAFARAFNLLLLATLPVAGLLAVVAQPLVHFVYGSRWQQSAWLLAPLVVLACVRVLGELAYDYLVAQGRTRASMAVQSVWFLALLPALVVGTRVGGSHGTAVAHMAVALLVAVPAYVVVLARGGVSPRLLFSASRRPLLVGTLAVISGWAGTKAATAPLVQLALAGTLAGLVCLFLAGPQLLRAVRMRPMTHANVAEVAEVA